MGYHLGAAADTGCYRFKSERRRIRDKKQHFDKQLLKLDRELKALYLERRKLPMVPLMPPVQRGWVRYFVLREDVADSKNGAFFQALLDLINTKEHCNRKDFKTKKRRKAKWKYRQRQQQLRHLSERTFHRLTEKEQQYFEAKQETDGYKNVCIVYAFKEKWRFVLKVAPDMVTHIRQLDPDIESRIREIDNYLDKTQYIHRFLHLRHGAIWWRYRFTERDRYEYANTPLHAILGMIEAAACTEQNKLT